MNKYAGALVLTIIFVVGFFLFRAFVKPSPEVSQKRTSDYLLKKVNQDSRPLSKEERDILFEKVRNK